jgi:S1-C subfamily serine protease
MKKLSRSLIILGSAILIYIAGLFGTSVLNNYHLKYLRNLGENVILIYGLTGAGATGFIVHGKSGKTYVMTNNHVCSLEKLGTILGKYKDDTYILTVEKRYPMNDLCVMAAPSTFGPGFKIAKNYNLGQTVYAIGHPLLEPLSISIGELSDIIPVSVGVEQNGKQEDCTGPTYEYITDKMPPMLQAMGLNSVCIRTVLANTSSLIILPGNSGSPVLDIWGQVVGVAFASNDTSTRSYIVPLSSLHDFLENL